MRRFLFGSSIGALLAGVLSRPTYTELAGKRPPPKRPRTHWLDSGSTPANKRAAARLKEHRAIWDNTPSADKMTRQRMRRMAMGRV